MHFPRLWQSGGGKRVEGVWRGWKEVDGGDWSLEVYGGWGGAGGIWDGGGGVIGLWVSRPSRVWCSARF